MEWALDSRRSKGHWFSCEERGCTTLAEGDLGRATRKASSIPYESDLEVSASRLE